MLNAAMPPGSEQPEIDRFSLLEILFRLRPGHLLTLLSALTGVVAVAYYFGATFDPAVQETKAENQRLTSTLAALEIEGGERHELSVDSFIARSPADVIGMTSLFDGRLFVPALSPSWAPFTRPPPALRASSHAVPLARTHPVNNDLTLLAHISGVAETSLLRVFPSTAAFNVAHPPGIWIGPHPAEQPDTEPWIPFIQLSVISRENAAELMRAINEDGISVFPSAFAGVNRLLRQHLSAEGAQLVDERLERLLEPTFALQMFVRGAFTPSEQETVLGALGATEAARQQRLGQIADEAEQYLQAYFEVPSKLLGNGMESLAAVTPESGLLLGRLLFYVLAISANGRVDIEHMTLGYSGSYARTRRAVHFSRADASSATVHVFDHILILATKSDFCLIHVRVPHFDDRLRQLDRDAQAWLRQIRMREFR